MTVKTFTYSAAIVVWQVPVGVTSVTIEMYGGGGGDQPGGGGQPGRGGYLKLTRATTPGEQWMLVAGGKGAQGVKMIGAPGAAALNGGRGGWSYDASKYSGSGGGGCSICSHYTAGDLTTTAFAVCGGGGASGYNGGGTGGDGGGTTGANGSGTHAGHGGTQSAGGSFGVGAHTDSAFPATAGSAFTGGWGYQGQGGGGGAGYYGGGGGGSDGVNVRAYGGGGGSSWQTGGTAVTSTRGGGTTGNGQIILTYIMPPNAPAPQAPVGNAAEDVSQPLIFQWLDSFNEPGDAQISYEVQYRIKGASAWTSFGQIASAGIQHTAAGGTFTADQTYEWQVRVAGQKSGTFGPWSASSYFTTITPPHTVIVVSPATGEIVTNTNYNVTWMLNPADINDYQQQAFQLVIYGDDGLGNADTTNVLFDSGVIGGDVGGLQSWPVVFPTGDYQFHVAISIMADGVWAPPTDQVAVTSIDPPNPPTITATPQPGAASIFLTVANVTGNGAPLAVVNEIWRSEDGVTFTRVADNVPVNGSWTDVTPAHGKLYYYQAAAVASTGARAFSG